MKNVQNNNTQGSMLPKIFNQDDIKTFETLKSATEDMLKLRQETTNQLGKVSEITGNLATISQSAAVIRQSDNNVYIMSQKIAADKEKWHDMLTHIFSGRDKAIDKFIDLIDGGVKSNNNEMILKAMDGLSTIVASSPWPDFSSFNKLIDSGGEIELF